MRAVALDALQPFQAVNLLSDPGAIGGPRHVPQCADILLRFSQENGKQGVIVLTGRYAGAFHGTVSEASAILAALTTGASWTALAAFMPLGVGLNGLWIHDINPTDGSGPIVKAPAAGGNGTSASAPLPNEIAAVITKNTGRTGRQFRGRMYFPDWATNALGAGNVIAPAAVTALQNWATNNVGSALSASGYTHVLAQMARAAYVSPKTGTAFPARPAGSVDITSLTVRDNHWDSQRRRGLK